MSPIGTVQVIYAAFARSDIPAVLAVVSPDVDGEYAGNRDDMPWLRRRLGHAGGAVFSRELPESLHIEQFTPTAFLEGPGGGPGGRPICRQPQRETCGQARSSCTCGISTRPEW